MEKRIIENIDAIIKFLKKFKDKQSYRYRRFFEELKKSGDDNIDVVLLASFPKQEGTAIRACYDTLQRYMILNHSWSEICEKEEL